MNSPIFTRLCQIFICFFFNFWPDATHTKNAYPNCHCPPDWPTWLAPSPSSSALWRWPNRNPLKKLLAIGDPKIFWFEVWNHQYTWSHVPKKLTCRYMQVLFFQEIDDEARPSVMQPLLHRSSMVCFGRDSQVSKNDLRLRLIPGSRHGQTWTRTWHRWYLSS